MAHVCDSQSLDAKLDNIADNADKMFLCSGASAPATYAAASVTNNLATRNMTVGDGNGDYAIAAGPFSGSRKLTVSEQASISISASGDYRWLVLADSVNQRIKYVVDKGSALAVNTLSTLTEPAFDIVDLQPVTLHTLTYTAGDNGSISGTSPQQVVAGLDGAAVTAVPDSGFVFVDWDDDSTANPRTDTNVAADVDVTANFEAE